MPDNARTELQELRRLQELEARAAASAPSATAAPGQLALEGMHPALLLLAGAGKAIVDTGRGIRQLGVEAGEAAGFVPRGTGARLREEVDRRRQLEAPLLESTAGKIGNIAGHVGTFLVPGGAASAALKGAGALRAARGVQALVNPSTYGAAAASGALQGAIQPVGTQDSRAANAATGALFGAAGNAAANTLGRIARPLKQKLSADEAQAVATLDRAGVPLDAAQRSGSRVARLGKAALADNPASTQQLADSAARQQAAFNAAVLREIGEQADAATPEVLQAARTRIGSYFDAVAERVPVRIDAPLGRDVQQLMQEARDVLLPDEAAVLDRLMQVVQQRGAYGQLAGPQFQRVRSALNEIAQRRDSLGRYAGQLRGAFDRALERSARGTTDAALIRDARRQWHALLRIEDAIGGNADGNISPARLHNVLSQKKHGREALYEGRGNRRLNELARAGKRILTERTPNSGTPARLAAQLAPAAVVSGATALATGDLETAAKLGAATYLAPKAGAALLTHPQLARYVGSGLPPGVARNALASPVTGALVRRGVPAAALAEEQRARRRKVPQQNPLEAARRQ